MFTSLLLLFLLNLVPYVSASPLTVPESLSRLIPPVPIFNNTPPTSTNPSYAKQSPPPPPQTTLTTPPPPNISSPLPFHIENSTITLQICPDPHVPLPLPVLRTTLFNAYTLVSNLISISGDGALPASSDPFVEAAEGVYIYMRSDRFRKMRWSNVKDVLWSLREYMVVEGHAVRTAFAVTEAEGGGMLGFGQVLEGGPRMRASDGGMMSGTVSCV